MNIRFKNGINKLKIVLLPLILCFILINYRIEGNKTKICLCVIAKNENLYVKEYVKHYKKIGYNKIFIYDNNDKNGEDIGKVIKKYIDNGFVEIIDYRERNENSRPQIDSYKDCYFRNNQSYNWLSFFDMDEFLEINKKYNKIQDFLNEKIFDKCQNIKINWLWYYDKNLIYYENKPIQERIKIFDSKTIINRHIKSTVRGNLSINFWNKALDPHSSLINITSCSSSGKVIKSSSPFNYPPDYTNAKLKHYSYKSFEEYCLKSIKGKADSPKNMSDYRVINQLKVLFEKNKIAQEKFKILYKIYNNSIYNQSLVFKKFI